MKQSIIPKMLFETEDLITLSDKGIEYEEGTQTIGKIKVPCYKFYGLDEMQVFDALESHQLLESEAQERFAFANRATAIIFLQIRKVSSIKTPETKVAAIAALTSSVMALGAVNARIGQRFLSLVRSLS